MKKYYKIKEIKFWNVKWKEITTSSSYTSDDFFEEMYGVLKSVFFDTGRLLMPLSPEDGFVAVLTNLVVVLRRDIANRDVVGLIDNLFDGTELVESRDNFEGVGVDVTGRVFVGVATVNLTEGIVTGALSETDLRIEVVAGLFEGDNFPFSRTLCLTGVFSIDGMRDFFTALILDFCSYGFDGFDKERGAVNELLREVAVDVVKCFIGVESFLFSIAFRAVCGFFGRLIETLLRLGLLFVLTGVATGDVIFGMMRTTFVSAPFALPRDKFIELTSTL